MSSFTLIVVVFFFKQKTAYEMRISDWFRRVLFRSMVMDQLVEMFSSGAQSFDRDGRLAARGHPSAILQTLEEHPFFREMPPKSAGQIGRASCRARVCQYV